MAGSTRLLGFAGSKLRLYRWGQTVDVEVGEPAVQAIALACRDQLPERPPAPGSGSPFAEFDAVNGGRVCLWLMPEGAVVLADILRSHKYADGLFVEQVAEQLEEAAHEEKAE